jgi:hypothetical protein
MADIIVVKMSMNTPLHRMTQCRNNPQKVATKMLITALSLLCKNTYNEKQNTTTNSP